MSAQTGNETGRNLPSQGHQTLLIEKSLPSERLDVYLRSHFPTVSRGTFQRLLEQGDVRVNGQQVKPTHTPRAGEVIEIHWPKPKASEAKAEDMPLAILFEDEDLLVLDKPPELVVHPSAGHDEHTLVNALLHHCHGQLSGIGGVIRPGIVHRLDKGTSGCLVIAKNDATHAGLAAQFANRTVQKFYQGLLCGEMSRDSGEIRAAIARHPNHRKRMAVTDGSGREAWTSYRVLQRLQAATHVKAQLHTGRTHQIRVHFHHLGFPLVGDLMYGKRHNLRFKAMTGYIAPRQMLHASQLAFVHPKRQELMSFEAPLPDDFREALATLKKLAGKESGLATD
jgi:23S rRNA pseudouridine1911/1915/1917 synthase